MHLPNKPSVNAGNEIVLMIHSYQSTFFNKQECAMICALGPTQAVQVLTTKRFVPTTDITLSHIPEPPYLCFSSCFKMDLLESKSQGNSVTMVRDSVKIMST